MLALSGRSRLQCVCECVSVCVLPPSLITHAVCATHRIAAGLMDDDPVGEGLIMGLDVKRPLFPVQGVFLDEVHVVYPCDLKTQHTHGSQTDHTRVQKKAKLHQPKAAYPLQQARGVHVQSAAPLDSVGGSVLVAFLTDYVARHKHGDEVTGGEPALIGLESTGERGSVSYSSSRHGRGAPLLETGDIWTTTTPNRNLAKDRLHCKHRRWGCSACSTSRFRSGAEPTALFGWSVNVQEIHLQLSHLG